MSVPHNSDPRIDQAAVTDEALLAAHEKLLERQPDDKGHYRLMPLVLLFMFSGLIFFSGTYLGLFGGKFDPHVYNEHAQPGGAAAAAATAPVANPIEVGKKIYSQTCASCHQVTGLGQPPGIPPLAGSEWAQGSEERVIRAVMYGLQGPIKVKGAEFNSAMPPNGKVAGSGFNLSDDKLAAVLTYVRQEWGNQAGPITTEQVAAIHSKEGDHKQFTADELMKLP
jgi:mono/diheme cytochrome c family protein